MKIIDRFTNRFTNINSIFNRMILSYIAIVITITLILGSYFIFALHPVITKLWKMFI